MACSLYLLSPPQPNDLFLNELSQALNADHTDRPIVNAFQLRLKKTDGSPEQDDTIKAIALKIQPLLKQKNIPLIINDRPDLVLALGADGVHLGADDMPVREARALLGRTSTIGASAYDSGHLAMVAGEAGADYIAFGAFFESTTKKAKTKAPIDLLKQWHETSIMSAGAIGGITPENARPLIEAGADFIAVSSAVWQHPQNPAAAIALFYHTLAL